MTATRRPLKGVDAVPWPGLATARGTAADVPVLLRRSNDRAST
ncbi:hypothetical protein [Yinghuangia seranimata]|nr:hypothetical protein [Yinghuangia seranimata]MDI2129718.1 hypothetical protein [Yinghuangia seranimata]